MYLNEDKNRLVIPKLPNIITPNGARSIGESVLLAALKLLLCFAGEQEPISDKISNRFRNQMNYTKEFTIFSSMLVAGKWLKTLYIFGNIFLFYRFIIAI